MRLEPTDLDLQARQGIRLVLRGYLRETLRELTRLERATDGEALHDFRVSLRRLRSLARALTPRLPGELRRRQLRRLRDYANATGEARDAEVFLGLLAELRGGLTWRDVAALDWLAARLSEQAAGGHGQVAREQLAGYRKLARGLDEALVAAQEADEDAGRGRTLGRVLAECIESQTSDLLGALDEVKLASAMEPAHRARIAGKRLRYLLEPLRGCARADAAPAVAALKELQDRLGEMHDAHVLGEVIHGALLARAEERVRRAHSAVLGAGLDATVLRSASRDPLLRGLLVLDAQVADRAIRAFASLQADWLPSRRQELAAAVAGLCTGLSRPAAGESTSRRVFLLLRIPESIASEPITRVEMGWLPGPAPRSMLVREHGPAGAHQRLLGDEPGAVPRKLGADQFSLRWPETVHSRLACERRTVVRNGRQWTIDAVEPAGPILAETSVGRGEAFRLPRWLARELIRDVTEERAYQLERLAARRSRPPPGPPSGQAPPGELAGVEGGTPPHLDAPEDLTLGDRTATAGQILVSGPGEG